MIGIRKDGRPVFMVMVVLALLLSMPHQAARAALVGTEAAAGSLSASDARVRLQQWLEREDVAAALSAQGIDPAEARARVHSLTDAELERVAGQIERLPAGGSAIGLAIGVLLIVLIVVVILKVANRL
jgi:hypothetical protein